MRNLETLFLRADKHDYTEGMLAYERYHKVMRDLSALYGVELPRVVSAFCALSPNNDYYGNLRSTVSVLHGWKHGVDPKQITTTTYRHCQMRAYAYVAGHADFLTTAKGPKIRSFYHNVLDPFDNRFVTIDGHMAAAWRGKALTMKEAILKSRTRYDEIAEAVKALSFRHFILPSQYQAIVWFARKRIYRVKYNPQVDLFAHADQDIWQTYRDVKTIQPFPRKGA